MVARVQRWYRTLSPQAVVLAVVSLFALVVVVVLAFTGTVGVPVAIATAAIPVSLGLVGQFVSSDRQHKREIEAKLRERKSAVYEGFIKFWIDHLMLKENRDKFQRNPNQAAKSMNEYSKAMMLWASNDVVQSYAEYRRRLIQGRFDAAGQSGIDSMIHFEQMLFLMREDMGHDPKGFRQFDLLSFFINDIHLYERDEDGAWQKTQQG